MSCLYFFCLRHSLVTTYCPRPHCSADSAPRIHSWQLTLASRVDVVRRTDRRSRYGISENILSSSGWGSNTVAMFRWNCLVFRLHRWPAYARCCLLPLQRGADTKAHHAGCLFYAAREKESVFVSLCLSVPGPVSVAVLSRCHI